MLLPWVFYTLLTGLLVSLAVLALDATARQLRLPARGIWFFAMVATVIVPAFALVSGSPAPFVTGALGAAIPALLELRALSAVGVNTLGADWLGRIDLVLFGTWGIASASLLVQTALHFRGIRRLEREWIAASVDGVGVRVSTATGPALVGVRAATVVLPRWVLDLDAPLRALVLAHELEHRGARDPLLLFGARLLNVLVPWHLPLQWQARRLQLAIEIDCDARVLRSRPDVERYSRLLLAVAHMPPAARGASVAFNESFSHLERRILAMHRLPARRPRIRATALVGLAAALFAITCGVPAPDSAPLPPTAPTNAGAQADFTSVVANSGVDQPARLLKVPRKPVYPSELRRTKQEGSAKLTFVIDAEGRPVLESVEVLQATHPAFAASAKAAIPYMTFAPATHRGRAVAVRVELPFEYSLEN